MGMDLLMMMVVNMLVSRAQTIPTGCIFFMIDIFGVVIRVISGLLFISIVFHACEIVIDIVVKSEIPLTSLGSISAINFRELFQAGCIRIEVAFLVRRLVEVWVRATCLCCEMFL